MLSRRSGRPAARPATAPTARLGLVVAAALALSACSGDGGEDAAAPSATAGASATADLSGVTVTDAAEGATGDAAVPVVTVPAGLSVGQTTSEVRSPGDGDVVEAGDIVSVDFVGVNGATGTRFGASGFDGSPVSFLLGPGVIPGFSQALEGVAAGSRVLVAVAPEDGYGPQGGLPDAGIGAEDTLVYLLDVHAVGPGHAEGTPVPADQLPAGLPTVVLDETTRAPTVTVDTAATPPAELVSQVLVQGAGPAVQAGQTLTVQYTGVNWRTGEPFDSSWGRGTPLDFPLGAGQVIDGWDQGLAGATVGSQLLLVIPPELGYGPNGGQPSAGIEATDTLVFVVDVLAAQ